ncbi:hypothetical protein DSL72_007046 [Monilinia vaccinii-corymbosi]|uniref:Copper acquisition factor BIM1-like domain-containing protein n=1 Tax=Monilinia vaccinii-corymbosi TaxID=61207 RepID=A0A8A3PLV8_9HELO|nr:hypothetical protein DSL72_007046 [Monilinia vaccinii-corymbosi]
MTTLNICLLFSLLSSFASAHFALHYPPSRGDSFLPPASQWVYPCANINTTENRTLYPTDSFAVGVELHHNWTYMFVNIGLGTNGSSNLNISLTPSPLNVTGKGSLCLKELDIPAGLKLEDGLNATVQVVTIGPSGSALYNASSSSFSSPTPEIKPNPSQPKKSKKLTPPPTQKCADITFSANASGPNPDTCANTGAITVGKLSTATANSSTTSSTSSTSSSTGSSSGVKSAGTSLNAAVVVVLSCALGFASLLFIQA